MRVLHKPLERVGRGPTLLLFILVVVFLLFAPKSKLLTESQQKE